jgi:biotin carboxyl carrier protein
VRLQFTVGKKLYQVQMERAGEGYQVTVNGKPFDVKIVPEGFSIGGKVHSVKVSANQGDAVRADVDGKIIEALILDIAKAPTKKTEEMATKKTSEPIARMGHGKTLMAPMPGKIVKVMVSVGQRLKVGEVVLILEAMKMENEIRSPFEGTVKEVKVGVGAGVAAEEPLIIME